MKLELGLLADDAIADATGKLYILGEFTYIFVQTVPARQGRFAVIARFVADAFAVRGKKNVLDVEFRDQDAEAREGLPAFAGLPMNFEDVGPAARGQMRSVVILKLDGIILGQYGDHVVYFRVNGEAVGSISFHVAQLPSGMPNAG